MKQYRTLSHLFCCLTVLILSLAVFPGISLARYGVTINKIAYSSGEPVKVRYSGAPGATGDWISVVRVGIADNEAGKNWQWIPGGYQHGYMTFYISSPGEYEVRVYYNYRRNGYLVSARQQFTIMSKNSYRSYSQLQQDTLENPEYLAESWNDIDYKIQRVQNALIKLGYDLDSADGLLGKRTKSAIRDFQRDNGLELTGYLDRKTLTALGLMNHSATNPPTATASAMSQFPETKAQLDTPTSLSNENPELNQQNATPQSSQQDVQTPAKTEPAQKEVSPWQGQVVAATVLLSEPNPMAEMLGNIPGGSLVSVVAEQKGFYKIHYRGKECFIYSTFVKQE